MATLSDRIEDYCFFDFETRADSAAYNNLPAIGTYKYARHAHPIIMTFAIGDGPVRCLSIDDRRWWHDGTFLERLPDELVDFCERVQDGKAWFAAWKTSFDRAIWNNRQPGDPGAYNLLEPKMTIDVMCQALASNLPSDLQSASTVLGGPGKQKDGKKLIQMFSTADGATHDSHPEEWARFKSYAIQDTKILRDIFKATRPLSRREWQEYWASEEINERGVAVDVAFCEKADRLAGASIGWANAEIYRLTGRPTMKVSTPKQIADWVWDNLCDAEARGILEQEIEDEDDVEDEVEARTASKLKLTRAHIVRLRQYLAVLKASGRAGPMDEVIDKVLELREYGGAASVAKFRKMADQASDEGGNREWRLRDSYVFNGAMQTGRFSSRGIQVHNLPRDNLGSSEERAIEDIMGMDGSFFDGHVSSFAARYGSAGKALSRLIRPALIAPPDKTLVWGDWSNIEARVNPWLSLSRSGAALLNVFRASDADPSLPGVYEVTAGDILDKDAREVTKAERQAFGKVPVLSLGFGGGKDALLRMAAAYGVAMSEETAHRIVDKWREANPWAKGFWTALWEAIQNAVEGQGTIFKAGRVSYLYSKSYMGGSLFCALPCGRILTYPKCHWEEREVEDKKTGERQWRWQLTYGKGHGRAALWYGKACENVTQAAAGSLLRAKLVTLEKDHRETMPVVLHTHDDICCEVDMLQAGRAQIVLADVMRTPEQWSGGLPLAAETSTNWWFTTTLK